MLDLVWVLYSKLLLIAAAWQDIAALTVATLRQVRLLSVGQTIGTVLLITDRVSGALVELVMIPQLLQVSWASLRLPCSVKVRVCHCFESTISCMRLQRSTSCSLGVFIGVQRVSLGKMVLCCFVLHLSQCLLLLLSAHVIDQVFIAAASHGVVVAHLVALLIMIELDR